MSPHLEHRLPWGALADIVRHVRTPLRGNRKARVQFSQLKQLFHFARCLRDALSDFAASDASTDAERIRHDPAAWGMREHSFRFEPGHADSLLVGYVELNLILSDPVALTPLVLKSGKWLTDAMEVMSSDSGDRWRSHPQWLAAHLRTALDGSALKPLTADVLQILRDHCFQLFRCMYSTSGGSRALDPLFVAFEVAERFGFEGKLRAWEWEHPGEWL